MAIDALYQHRDNDLQVTVRDEAGNQLNPDDFENAIYVIYVKSTGTEVLRKTLGSGISSVGGVFNVDIAKDEIPFSNVANIHWHTMVIGYTATEERPQVFDEETTIIAGINL